MHRPYPPPNQRPCAISMTWKNLLFAHWPVDSELIRPLIPSELGLDLWEGRAWIGIVPFEMEKIRPRGLPAMPWLSNFPELNVRTYVIKDGKPGVWFFSLDAGNKIAVKVARLIFHLPYFDATFKISRQSDQINYSAQRTHRIVEPAEIDISYRPTAVSKYFDAGSLEYWLTARYCLYSANKSGKVFRGEIDHSAWPLQVAEAEIRNCDMTRVSNFQLQGSPASLLYCDSIDVVAWPLLSV